MLQHGDTPDTALSPPPPQQQQPALNEIFQQLNKHDAEWLTATLRERWQQLLHKPEHAVALRQQWPTSSYDVTLPYLPEALIVSPYVLAFRDHDWSSTDFGSMSTWSLDLRRMVNRCLNDPHITALFVGPRLNCIYNERYAELLGDKHPHSLGLSLYEVWSELSSDQFRPFSDCQRIGTASSGVDMPFIVNRSGFKEELCVTWTATPFVDDAGAIMGCYNSAQDNTSRETLARRMATLLSLGQATTTAIHTLDFWKQAMLASEPHHKDVPFAVVYSYAKEQAAEGAASDNVTSSSPSPPPLDTARRWSLVSTVGLSADRLEQHQLIPAELDVSKAALLFGDQFHAAMVEGKAIPLNVSAGTFSTLFAAVDSSRLPFAPCQSAVLFPVCPANHDDVHGFVLLGLNPMTKYDVQYQDFVRLLQRQLETSLASVLLVESKMRQLRVATRRAAEDQARLTAQLVKTQQEAIENRSRFRAMFDMAPLAMFHLDESGDILYANQNWIDITQHSIIDWGKKSWFAAVHHEDKDVITAGLARLRQGESVSFSMRWDGDYAAKDAFYIGNELVSGATWTIATAYPEKREDGSVKGVVGCLTDISKQKWIEGLQQRRMQEALNLKRQQENFMDMISHEARNPLSAIMLCTESILDLLKTMCDSSTTNDTHVTTAPMHSTVSKGIEDAEIILACAQHQKRMIDDVLTLSKLDAGLLLIDPVEVQPLDTITQTLKMFDVEMVKHEIEKSFNIHPSCQELQIDWLKLDPNRLVQVLINLLTNAIKFTKGEPTKRIDITMSASLTRPLSSLSGVMYVPDTTPRRDEADSVFLTLEVRDTGCGIRPNELIRLFEKFQQATPKTSVEYGGSGLGLFISKQLTQMLGGSIGATSDHVGSTFAFYIMAPRCRPPVKRQHSAQSTASINRTKKLDTNPVNRTNELDTTSVNNTKGLPITAKIAAPVKTSQSHVLIVEDNLVNQKVLRSQLERLQYPVSVANHGLEALEYVERSHFCKQDGQALDIMLLDIEMPMCNGLDCARQIRSMEESGKLNGHIPIIGVTANARAEQQKAALDAGMDAVVTKPFKLKALSQELDKMLNQSYAGG